LPDKSIASQQNSLLAVMWIRARQNAVEVWCPAKLNLFFAVKGKRDDGYHEIETLMAAVDRYDTLYVTPDLSGEVSISCGWAGSLQPSADDSLGKLPSADQNLAVRAVRLLKQRFGVESGARLKLVKRIPAAAGLGGASSDAAGALAGADRVWGLGLSDAQLANLASELGSDVPFFLGKAVAICRGRGELVEPVSGTKPFYAVIVRPPVGLATAGVYAQCRVVAPERPIGQVIGALRTGELGHTGMRLYNGLERAAAGLTVWIDRLRQEFQRMNCETCGMSGSGSSYFGVCRDRRDALRVAAMLRGREVGQVFAVRTIPPGECC
jgi:4-diphosphocytidyl-2-C-methyl-D-erythritol kinase